LDGGDVPYLLGEALSLVTWDPPLASLTYFLAILSFDGSSVYHDLLAVLHRCSENAGDTRELGFEKFVMCA
jgi:hypothetical protein